MDADFTFTSGGTELGQGAKYARFSATMLYTIFYDNARKLVSVSSKPSPKNRELAILAAIEGLERLREGWALDDSAEAFCNHAIEIARRDLEQVRK